MSTVFTVGSHYQQYMMDAMEICTLSMYLASSPVNLRWNLSPADPTGRPLAAYALLVILTYSDNKRFPDN